MSRKTINAIAVFCAGLLAQASSWAAPVAERDIPVWVVGAGIGLLAIIFILLAIVIRANRRVDELTKSFEAENARLSDLSEHVPGMIYQYCVRPDGSSYYPFASKGTWDLFHISPKQLQENAENLFVRLHPEDIEPFRERIRESARTLSSWNAEYRVIFPDGTVYWRESLALPSRQEDGSTLWRGFATDITERKLLEEKLAHTSDLHLQVLSSLGEGVVGVDLQGCITFVNAKAIEMLGWSEEEMLGQRLYELTHQAYKSDLSYSEARSVGYPPASSDKPTLIEDWFSRKGGGSFPVALLTTAVEKEGTVWGKVVSFRDITEQQAAEAKNLLLVSALEASANAILITDLNTKIEWVNPAFCAMTGYEFDEVIGRTPRELVFSGHHDSLFYDQMWRQLQNGEPWRGEIVNRCKDGSLIDEELIITPVKDASGKILHYIGVKQNISERKRMEEELRAQASTDMLTGLPNRRSFFSFAETELARIKRGKENPAALIMLDLDRFKRINDTYGHGVGDLVLQQMATIILNTLRRGDYSGRIGGEEFVMLLPDTTIEQATHFAERLRRRIEVSVIETDGIRISYTASFGLTAMVASDESIDMTLVRADEAMYNAKKKGRNRVEIVEAPAE